MAHPSSRRRGTRARFGITCPAVPPPVRTILFTGFSRTEISKPADGEWTVAPEGAGWYNQGMPLIAPWNHIENTLGNLQDFDEGAQKLSDFFKGKEEKHGPDELLELFFQSDPPQKTLERV